ncbi:MAG: HNH endonuclease signature motif containing protein, partial [Candidatus Sulfotelmatobacter sp.]
DVAKPALGHIHEQMLALLREHPEGVSEGEMRLALRIKAEEQTQFGRRRRDLHYYYRIDKKRIGKKTVYIFRGPLETPRDATPTSTKTRAMVLHASHGRCGMCGQTIEKHGITLVVDHKIPREWGGRTESENLWAICEECNHGKKNLFASVDSAAMRAAILHDSVHVRIGELLKGAGVGEPVPSRMIDFVANQDEWRKRLRELRYLGWEVTAIRTALPGGRFQSAYRLDKSTDWPPDPSGWIRNYEKERAKRNKR